MQLREVAEHDEVGVRLVLATGPLEVGGDGALEATARAASDGEEVAVAVRIAGGLQPSRVGGEVNPLARVVPDAVVLRPLGEPTARLVAAAARAWGGPPPPKPKWRLFRGAPAGAEVRFAALLVTREGDATQPRRLHYKLFCDGGELYLDVDADKRELALVEKDVEFRPALLRALEPLAPPG